MPPNEALEGGRRACFIYSTRGYRATDTRFLEPFSPTNDQTYAPPPRRSIITPRDSPRAFPPQTLDKSWGMLVLIFFVFIAVLLLLNLLIAVMSEAYEEVKEVAEARWAYVQMEMLMEYQADQVEENEITAAVEAVSAGLLGAEHMGVEVAQSVRRLITFKGGLPAANDASTGASKAKGMNRLLLSLVVCS